jgi:hypothetical protein
MGDSFFVCVAEFAAEPGAGEGPVAFDGAFGDAEGFGDFVDVHAAEEAEFDDLGLAGVDGSEFFEGFVECEDVFVFLGGEGDGFVEGDAGSAAAAFIALVGAGVVDEDAAHGLGGDGEEVVFALPIDAGLVDEFHVGFVDEGGGLEGVVEAFLGEVVAGQSAEFVVNEREELVGGTLVAALQLGEYLGDIFAWGGHGILGGKETGDYRRRRG